MLIKGYFNRRNVSFLILFVLAYLMAYAPIKALYDSSSSREYYSHIVLIPLVSIYLIFQKRKVIFSEQEYSLRAGMPLLLMGALLYFTGRGIGVGLNQNDMTSLIALSAVVFINGAFILSYGVRAFRAALFPLPVSCFRDSHTECAHGCLHFLFTDGFHGIYRSAVQGHRRSIFKGRIFLSPAGDECRSGQTMQRHTVQPGASDYGYPGRSYVSEDKVEKGFPGRFDCTCYDVQEWDTHFDSDVIGNLCGSKVGYGKQSPSGWRDCIFHPCTPSAGAGAVLFEERGNEKFKDKTKMNFSVGIAYLAAVVTAGIAVMALYRDPRLICPPRLCRGYGSVCHRCGTDRIRLPGGIA